MYNSVLKTDGYAVHFCLKPAKHDPDFVDAVIAFTLEPPVGVLHVTSIPTFIHRDDLLRLVEYLTHHMEQLVYAPHSDSDVFVPLELGFQVRAYSGAASSANEGAFSLDVKVHVGNDANNARVYIGGEAVVSFGQIMSFTQTLRSTLDLLPF